MELIGILLSPVLLYSVLLAAVCLIGDKCATLLSWASLWVRAAVDNGVHGAVSVLAWAVVDPPGGQMHRWLSCALCGALASSIDVDHFLVARSLQIQDAVSLKSRPPFHSTTLVLLLTATLLSVSTMFPALVPLRKLALMCLTAWLSHHLRDATRRGLWFPPIGSTPPVPYLAYILGTVLLALSVHFVFERYVQEDTAVSVQGGNITSILVQ